MTVESVVFMLEQGGYRFDVLGDQINVILPDNLLREHNELIGKIRQNKPAFLSHLRYRDFAVVLPAEGDLYNTTVDVKNEREVLRWALAVDTGQIALVGKVLFRSGENAITIRYRCPFPPEWLPDAITRAAKQKYNHTLQRVQKGEKWLQAHGEGHLEYQRAYDGYLALHENLRKLRIAVGESLINPMEGYKEVSACP